MGISILNSWVRRCCLWWLAKTIVQLGSPEKKKKKRSQISSLHEKGTMIFTTLHMGFHQNFMSWFCDAAHPVPSRKTWMRYITDGRRQAALPLPGCPTWHECHADRGGGAAAAKKTRNFTRQTGISGSFHTNKL